MLDGIYYSYTKKRTSMVTNEPAVAANGKYYISDIARVLGMHRNTVSNNMDSGVLKFQ